MAQDRRVDALVYFCGAVGDLLGAVLYWHLDLESADMTKDEALKLALEALEYRGGSTWLKHGVAVEAIKEALAQPPAGRPVREPVADRLERLLWEYIDLQAAHPEHRPNPKTWPHLMAYAPHPPTA
jgi:hypothetical protein